MTNSKTKLLHFALNSLYYSGAYRLLEPAWRGVGVIFTLHHVRPQDEQPAFAPNRILEISASFLERTIRQVLDLDYDIISLDEARQRLVAKDFERRFVCITLDDGYLDNYLTALPVFKKYSVPFTVYVATGMPSGTAVLWWCNLEAIINREDKIELRLDGEKSRLSTRTVQEKYTAFDTIYWKIRKMSLEQQNKAIDHLINEYHIDCSKACRNAAMSWNMIRELSDSGLATIGAHTVNHFPLSKLSPDEIRKEAVDSRDIILKNIGVEPKHFAYPYGDHSSAGRRDFDIIKELGFTTATTTRKGVLFPEHADYLHALPRVSLNGDYQRQRYTRLFLSGAPFAFWQKFQRLDVN